MLKDLIGVLGTYMFLFGSIYLALHFCVFKYVLVDKIVFKRFYLNELICIFVSILMVVVFFSVSIP